MTANCLGGFSPNLFGAKCPSYNTLVKAIDRGFL